MEPVFRPAKYRDISALCMGLENAFVPLLKKFYPGGYYAYFIASTWVKDKIDKEFVYVCQLGNEVVGGIIILKNPDEKNLKLHSVYVDESYRRSGLASFIISRAEQAHGSGVLWRLETLKNLTQNTALYEKLGYEMYSAPKDTGNGLTIVYYQKRL